MKMDPEDLATCKLCGEVLILGKVTDQGEVWFDRVPYPIADGDGKPGFEYRPHNATCPCLPRDAVPGDDAYFWN